MYLSVKMHGVYTLNGYSCLCVDYPSTKSFIEQKKEQMYFQNKAQPIYLTAKWAQKKQMENKSKKFSQNASQV